MISIKSASTLAFLFAGVSVLFAQPARTKNWAVTFRGNRVFTEAELITTTEKCLLADSHWNSAQTTETLDYCLWKLHMFLSTKGYLQAKVDAPKTENVEKGLRFVIGIREGPLYRIGKIRVEGATVLSPAEILGILTLRAGDIADTEKIGNWVNEGVKEAYAHLGYIQYSANVSPAFNAIKGSNEGIVDLSVTIYEGQCFLIHSIKFDGNGDVPEESLLTQMLLRSGDIFDIVMLKESLKMIDQSGYFEKIDPDRDVDYRADRENPRVDLIIHLRRRGYGFAS
jgi:outer membrane protein insertion porin family